MKTETLIIIKLNCKALKSQSMNEKLLFRFLTFLSSEIKLFVFVELKLFFILKIRRI